MGSLLLTWFMIGLQLGHAEVVRLLAANAFVQGARSLSTLEAGGVLTRYRSSDRQTWRKSRRRALRIDAGGLAACILLVVILAQFLWFRGMPKSAEMVLIYLIGVPARHPGISLTARRDRRTTWRLGAAAVAVTGGAAVLFFHLPWQAAALVMALRDWGGLLATVLFARRRPGRRIVPDGALTFHEVAARTEASTRKRLGYRLIRSVFGLLGPFGNIAARTSRGVGGLDRKVAALMPHSRAGFILFTAVAATASAVLLTISREPSALLVSAALANVAASAGAALLWWKYREPEAEGPEEEESDD